MPSTTSEKLKADRLAAAAQAEGEGADTVTVTWRGRRIVLPASLDDCDVSVALAFERSQGMTALLGVLGQAQFDALRPMTVREANELAGEVAQAMGFGGPGESPASSD